MAERILGIDPGLRGGLALLDSGGNLIDLGDMPVMPPDQSTRPAIDAPALAAIVRRWAPTRAFVELVSLMPSDSRASAWTFGSVAGTIRGVLAGLAIPSDFIPASLWKQTIGLPPGRGRKDDARALAARRWPRFAGQFSLKRDADKAEAALIALAGLELSPAA